MCKIATKIPTLKIIKYPHCFSSCITPLWFFSIRKKLKIWRAMQNSSSVWCRGERSGYCRYGILGLCNVCGLNKPLDTLYLLLLGIVQCTYVQTSLSFFVFFLNVSIPHFKNGFANTSFDLMNANFTKICILSLFCFS